MNFIGIYDDILTADDCNVIIQYFNKHPDKEAGQIGYETSLMILVVSLNLIILIYTKDLHIQTKSHID